MAGKDGLGVADLAGVVSLASLLGSAADCMLRLLKVDALEEAAGTGEGMAEEASGLGMVRRARVSKDSLRCSVGRAALE